MTTELFLVIAIFIGMFAAYIMLDNRWKPLIVILTLLALLFIMPELFIVAGLLLIALLQSTIIAEIRQNRVFMAFNKNDD